MAAGDVKHKFLADTTQAEAAFTKLERRLDAQDQKLKAVSRTSKRGNQEQLTGMQRLQAGVGSVTTSLAGMLTGYLALPAAIASVVSANREFLRQADEAATKYDTLFRKFRVQSGLSQLQGDEARRSILNVSLQNAFTAEQGEAAARQLVSSGFSAQQAQGPALDVLLKGLSAANQTGQDVDTQTLALAAAGYLNSQGQELTASNLQNVIVPVQRLFKGTNLQLGDLEAFSKQGAVFSGKLSSEEQFAGLAALRDINLGGSEATTALRNTVMALTSQKLDKEKLTQFKALGIDPSDVDLQGEGFIEVLDTLAAAFDATDPEMLDSILKKLFEKAEVANVKKLVENRAQIARNIGLQGDTVGFQTDVDVAQSGIGAAQSRLALQKEQADAQYGGQIGTYRGALEAVIAERIAAGEMAPVAGTMTRWAFGGMTSLGFAPETALGVMSGDGAEAQRRALASGGPEGLPGPPSMMLQRFSDGPRPVGRADLMAQGVITPQSTPAEIEEAMRRANQPMVDAIERQTTVLQGGQGGGTNGSGRESPPVNRNAHTE